MSDDEGIAINLVHVSAVLHSAVGALVGLCFGETLVGLIVGASAFTADFGLFCWLHRDCEDGE